MKLRRSAAGVLVGAAALSLVAAQSGTTVVPRGTAMTELTAVDLDITGLDLPGATVLDVTSFASTDTDAARNIPGGGQPWAGVGWMPLEIAGQRFGAGGVTSDGDTDLTTETLDVVDPTGSVSAVVNPVQMSATATAKQAIAAAQAATAKLGALGGSLGLDINTTGVASTVTQTASTATQGLRVQGLDIDLGDLVPADVLAALPIDVLIQLLDQLPVSLDVDLESIVDTLLATVESLETTTQSVVDTGTQLAGALDDLAAKVAELTDAEATLAAAQATLTNAESTLAAAQAALDEILDDLDTLSPAEIVAKYTECLDVLSVPGCLDATVDAANDAVDEAQADVDAALAVVTTATAEVDALTTAVETLRTTVQSLVDTLQTLVNDLVGHLTDLLSSLTELEGSLGDIVAALADGDVLSVGALDVGVVATAAETLEASSATVGCNEVPLELLGVTIATPDCSNPITTVSSVAATVTGAIQELLTTLPVPANTLPEVSIGIFPDVVETVSQEGDYIVAEAGVTLLDLSVGSVTIDPANLVSGLLDQLATQVDALVAGAIPDSGDLAGLGLPAEVTDGLTSLTGQLPTVGDLQTQLDAILAQLPDGSTLPTITTPGIDLVVDPSSSAQFAPGSTVPGPGPSPSPDPSPDPDPSLPTTGGGLALLGVLALGGAVALRRRA